MVSAGSTSGRAVVVRDLAWGHCVVFIGNPAMN